MTKMSLAEALQVAADPQRSTEEPPRNEAPFGRRLALFPFTDYILELFKRESRFEIADTWLPADAQIVTLSYDFMRHKYHLVLESEEFARVPEGEMIPELPPIVLRMIPREEPEQ